MLALLAWLGHLALAAALVDARAARPGPRAVAVHDGRDHAAHQRRLLRPGPARRQADHLWAISGVGLLYSACCAWCACISCRRSRGRRVVQLPGLPLDDRLDAAPLGAQLDGRLRGGAGGDLSAGRAPAAPHGAADHRGRRSAGAGALGRAGGAQSAPERGRRRRRRRSPAGAPGPTARPASAPTATPSGGGLPEPGAARSLQRDQDGAVLPSGRRPGELRRADHGQRQLLHRDQERRRRPGAAPRRLAAASSTARSQRPFELDYAALRKLPSVEITKTLECISNLVAKCELAPFGCDLISTARWQGRAAGGRARTWSAGVKPGRRFAGHDLGRRVHHRAAARGGHGAGHAAGVRDERPGAAARARLPGARAGARAATA